MSTNRTRTGAAGPVRFLKWLFPGRTARGVTFDITIAAVLLMVGGLSANWPLYVPIEVLGVGALSMAVRRLSPALALALGWLTGILQVATHSPPSLVQVASAVVVFSAAAWGRHGVMIASAASAGLGGLAAGAYLVQIRFASVTLFFATGLTAENGSVIVIVLLPVAFLAACWTAGFALRTVRGRRAEIVARGLAEERAVDAQEQVGVEQSRAAMARDVHDVVGHSLAVIIAQADSVRFLQDTERVREVVDTIASTARTSLLEVRGVLERTERERPVDSTDLDALVAQVRSAGVEVQERTEGTPGELEAASGLAARRVLQEMLTNALRHGSPQALVEVQRLWRSSDLVIEVTNVVGDGDTSGSGAGLTGMRERVHAVGGTLETDRIGDRFVSRARIPRSAP